MITLPADRNNADSVTIPVNFAALNDHIAIFTQTPRCLRQ
jgi:hypothetical protein